MILKRHSLNPSSGPENGPLRSPLYPRILLIILALAVVSFAGAAEAATCTSTATGGSWTSTTTWMADCGGGIPGAADTAVIATTTGNFVSTPNVTITVGAVIVNANGQLNIGRANWTVNGTTSVSGTIDQTNTGGNSFFIGLVTINNGGTWANTSGEACIFRGGITNNGTFDGGTGTQTFNTNNQVIGGSNLINFGGAVTIGNNVTVTNNNTDIVTIAGTLNGTNAGSAWVNGANSTLNYGSFTQPMATGALNASASGNTVNYNRGGGSGAQTVDPTSYYHLILSGIGAKTMTGVTTISGDLTISGTARMTNNAAFTVAGAFNYASAGTTTLTAATPISIGTYNQSAGALTDNSNTITVTGTGAGTWTQSGGTFTASGTVIFTGAAPQIGTSNFNNLTINVGSTATLIGNAIVSGALTLTNGFVTTGANVLEVMSSCATGIVRTNGHVSGNLTLHFPAGTTTCTFPIGDATAYTPATAALANVSSSLANSLLTARTDPGDHPDTVALLSGIDPGKSVNRYWTLTQGASLLFTTYAATFTFVNGDVDSGANTANFVVARKSGGVWTSPVMGARNPNDTTATGMNAFGIFAIGERALPGITAVKTVSTFSDPYNSTTNPKAIPGAVMLYTITVVNSGPGVADSDSVAVTDAVPADTIMCVSNLCSNPPVVFSCSAVPACGLTYTYASAVAYTNRPGGVGPYDYTPVPDANGYDAAVTGFRVNPGGVFSPSGGMPHPQFTIQFKVKIK